MTNPVLASFEIGDVRVQPLGPHLVRIEQRAADEVRGVSGAFGQTLWAPAQAAVFNPAFDVTPAKLVTGWVLDSGVYNQQQIAAGVLQQLNY